MSNPQVTHSIMSFSARERWSKCAISVHLSKGMRDEGSVAASEGTTAHTVAEFYVCQHFGLAHRDWGPIPKDAECPDRPVPEGLDLKGRTVAEWNADLRRHGKDYRDYIVSLIPAGQQAFVIVEQKVSIPSIHAQLFGTADCLVWVPALRLLILVDYKYGFMSVDVGTYEDTNPQLAAYLVAAEDGLTAQHMLPERGIVAVYQPRRILQQPAQSLEVDRAWFGKERDKLRAETQRVDSDPGAPVPGDHCRYCKGKPKCPAVQNALAAALEAHCGNKSVLDMPEDDLVQLFAVRGAFKAFWEDVEERIGQLEKKGHPNLQVKESQGRRMWGDTKLATQTFLAIGRADLLQPRSLSDVMSEVPEAYLYGLVARSKPSRTIQVVEVREPSAVAKAFAQYVKKS